MAKATVSRRTMPKKAKADGTMMGIAHLVENVTFVECDQRNRTGRIVFLPCGLDIWITAVLKGGGD